MGGRACLREVRCITQVRGPLAQGDDILAFQCFYPRFDGSPGERGRSGTAAGPDLEAGELQI